MFLGVSPIEHYETCMHRIALQVESVCLGWLLRARPVAFPMVLHMDTFLILPFANYFNEALAFQKTHFRKTTLHQACYCKVCFLVQLWTYLRVKPEGVKLRQWQLVTHGKGSCGSQLINVQDAFVRHQRCVMFPFPASGNPPGLHS